MIPVIILNALDDYFTNILEFFRLACRKFIDWVYLPKDSINSVDDKESGDIYNPFHNKKYDYSDELDSLEYNYNDNDYNSHEIGWKDYILFGVLAVAITYFLYPDMYNNLYYAIKGKIFPGGGGGVDPKGEPGNSLSDNQIPYKNYKGRISPVIPEHILRDNLEEIAFSGLTSTEKNASLLHLYYDSIKSGDVVNKSNQIADLAIELNNTMSANPTINPFTLDLNRLRYVTEPTSNLIMPLDLTSPESNSTGYITPTHPSLQINTNIVSQTSSGSITPTHPSLQINTNIVSQTSSGSITPTNNLSPIPSPAPLPIKSPQYPRDLDDLSWISNRNKLKGMYSPKTPERGVDIVDLMDKLNKDK
jgi:hypothetical protein